MIQYFNHALYVEIESEKGRSLLNYLYEIIIFKMNKSTEEIKTQIRFIDTNSSPLIATHHCWFISYNEEGAKWLLQLAIEAMSILRGRVGLKMFFFPHLPPETHVKLIDNTYISSEAFWPFILHFLADINSASYCNGNIYVATETNNNELLEDINKRFLNFTPSFIEEKVVYSPNRRDYKLIKFTDKMNYNMENSFDVGILTIVDEEARAIINGFGMDMNNPKIIDNHYYDEGEYEFDGKKIRLVHHQCTKQGNVQMAVAFMEMLKHYNPTYMVLLGIAGSIKQNINICDVVIASDILYYEPRKESGHEVIEHRLEHFNMSPAMNNRITRYRMVTSSPLSASADSFNSDFSLHVSPIGTGEAVIADSLSKTKEWLLTVNSKTGIVETEAAGFSSAFNFSTSDVRDILIIRGISDKADVTKDDKWRQPACDNAVIVLKDFMKKILFV